MIYLYPVLLTFLMAADADPNGFFKDKNWSVSTSSGQKIFAESRYLGEPVQFPNKVDVYLVCSKNKKELIFSKKYCGINYIKEVAGKLEVMFLDFNSKDSRGYCTKKRIKHYPLPSCSKK